MPDITPTTSQGPSAEPPSRSRSKGESLPPLAPTYNMMTLEQRASTSAGQVPSSPPPTYEDVLEENRVAQLARASSLETATTSSTVMEKPPPRPSTAPPPSTSSLQIQHKSSKKLYRAVAAQWGLTCKMSDKCRCLDCQSRYFESDYEQNEHNKSDGGLGATTPMFIAEIMGGSACTLL